MAHNILFTGVSGYLGGTLLNRWKRADLPDSGTVYAMVRTAEQATKAQQYGVHPLVLDTTNEASLTKAILDHEISVIYFLVESRKAQTQIVMIKALSEVRKRTRRDVHFLHTSGAKLFSSHVGHPTDAPLLDTDPQLYHLQKTLNGPYEVMNQAKETNNVVIETSEEHGVRCYVFAPCIVYGEGEGFGNRVSIQTQAIVKAATALRRVYRTDPSGPLWPVCHVIDNTNLYLEILRKILAGEDIGHGKSGYFLASAGLVAWDDLYSAMATAMAKQQVIDDASVGNADDITLEKMGQALGCPKDFVPVQLSGRCTFDPAHGRLIGWRPQYPPEDILEAADAEVELILNHLSPRM